MADLTRMVDRSHFLLANARFMTLATSNGTSP